MCNYVTYGSYMKQGASYQLPIQMHGGWSFEGVMTSLTNPFEAFLCVCNETSSDVNEVNINVV